MDEIRHTASARHLQQGEEGRVPLRSWIIVALEAAALAFTLFLTWDRL